MTPILSEHQRVTTPEESRALLELGAPPGAANTWRMIEQSLPGSGQWKTTGQTLQNEPYRYEEQYTHELHDAPAARPHILDDSIHAISVTMLPAYSAAEVMEMYRMLLMPTFLSTVISALPAECRNAASHLAQHLIGFVKEHHLEFPHHFHAGGYSENRYRSVAQ